MTDLKPPLGITPRWFWLEERADEVIKYISRCWEHQRSGDGKLTYYDTLIDLTMELGELVSAIRRERRSHD